MKIRKGDDVLVLTGKYRGERAEVIEALPSRQKVILNGLNVSKRATKQQGATMQAGIIDKFMPMPVSSVSLLCKNCGEPTRIGYTIDEQGRKLRICRKCGAEL